MDVSELIAKFIGPAMLVSAAAMLVNRKLIHAVFEDFMKSPGMIFIAGFLALMLGIAITVFHNLWVADWRVIITIYGWLALIGGVMRMVFPAVAISMGKRMIANETMLIVIAIANVLLGGFLTYMGYLA